MAAFLMVLKRLRDLVSNPGFTTYLGKFLNHSESQFPRLVSRVIILCAAHLIGLLRGSPEIIDVDTVCRNKTLHKKTAKQVKNQQYED